MKKLDLHLEKYVKRCPVCKGEGGREWVGSDTRRAPEWLECGKCKGYGKFLKDPYDDLFELFMIYSKK